MEISLLLIILGIVLLFFYPAIGAILILVALVLLIWPRIAAGRRI
jgi:hypothetical protein